MPRMSCKHWQAERPEPATLAAGAPGAREAEEAKALLERLGQ